MKNLKFIKKPKSLRWQLLLGFVSILSILLIIMGVSQYASMKEYLYKTKIQVLQQKFHIIDLKSLSEKQISDIITKSSLEDLKKLSDKNVSVAIIDKDGNTLNEIKNTENTFRWDIDDNIKPEEFKYKKIIEIPTPVLDKSSYVSICNEEGNLERTYKVVEDENGTCQLVVWRKIGDLSSPSGLIQLSTPIEDVEALLNREVSMHTSISILLLVVGTLFANKVFKRTLKPLYNITETVEKIKITDLDTKLSEDNGQLEINRLSNSFNTMLRRIEASFKKEQDIKARMRQFLSDASHELRTPLTSIHGFVEILLRGAAKNEEQLKLALNSILMESERLTKLVNDLLVLTKLEQQPIVEMKRENINELIEEIYPQLVILCGSRTLKLELGDNAKAEINRDQIKQVIFNITQNSVLHTDNNRGIITIATDLKTLNDENYAVLKIGDNGTGISKEHIDKIYDRFFRSEAHRSRAHGGYGLGLSIVKSIIDSNHGHIRVESEVGIGTTFYIYLKLAK